MDELAMLTQHRPDAPPPTDDERATARAAVMAHIAAGGATETDTVAAATDLAPRRRRSPRPVRRAAALVGVAAALVGGLLVAGGSEDAPAPLRDRPATAAEQVRTIATAAAASPFPDVPYVIDIRVDTATGGDAPSETTDDQRIFQVDPTTTVTDLGTCPVPCSFAGQADFGVPFPADADAATVRQAIDDQVAEMREQTREATGQDEDPARVRISLAVGALEGRTAGPAARAELLRILAESPGLTVQEGVTTAFGHTGTRITIEHLDIDRTFVVDPTDGYVLETGTLDLSDVEPPSARMGSDDDGEIHEVVLGPPSTERVTFDRPEPLTDLPDEVEQTVAAIDAGWDAAVADLGPMEGPVEYHCSGGDWVTEGFPGIPEGWRFMRCWKP